ncbi:bifunctional 4-hydroxy-2-oxoglutarate aldolase/2-dehydro-3-deoxy-phosphogluconate aldolase [Croceicoccus sp. F390]|uniref:2-dehydro-3-deoxy-phosphogluconate aldolase n=1 Tax=Croceicoccus esteveae TaxID=3075597 RepID=A0ABU2ZGF7_9SPHN|nr:bifunctional 4-hydroxy-2-oxoglutarate aldolase/2-dehydro-3-deoxy-phosphogluconate aldolase [Croceicoccus sp. F390]MDT0575404.1 bifunctional 4-hydroxy-2-oxoglutarate aldolase/2-dehydro-3-deoxy-phosphogluconate aldolase [Croceicoccus sp. F390]
MTKPVDGIRTIMTMAPVIPVIVVEEIAHAVPLAQALVAGGLPCLEVTLRTACAIDAIKAMSRVEGAFVGAGTVLNEAQLAAVQEAGARFIVSPGLTPSLGKAIIGSGIPFLPGVATATEIMLGLDMGLDHFKFFPAEASGGLPALKALAGPFTQASFCPTGGITASTAPGWLSHPQVPCVGGSWVAPAGLPDVARITAMAQHAASL